MENMLLPDDTPYAEITGLRLEARPEAGGSASALAGGGGTHSRRIAADVAVLMIYLEKIRRGGAKPMPDGRAWKGKTIMYTADVQGFLKFVQASPAPFTRWRQR